ASAFAAYATTYPRPGWAEQDPEAWWQSVCRSTRQILAENPEAAARLAAIGFSAMMNGCLLVDGAGRPLRPAIIHADVRSAAQSERIAAVVGEERAYRITGNRVAPYFTLEKLAWLADHDPDALRRARWCVQTKDYVEGRLTGVWGVTDPSDASLTGAFDMEHGAWSGEMLDAASIRAGLLPEVRPSMSVIGAVSEDAARETGLRAGLPVVLGGGDGACATAGAGVVTAGDAYHYLGGTSWVAAICGAYRPDPERRLSLFCALDPERFVLYGTVQSAGSSVDWLRQAIGTGSPETDAEESHAALERLAASAPPGSHGLFFLPYLAGERSPIWDSAARGAFIGLTAAHTRADLARAVFEGVAYALNSNLTALASAADVLGPIRALGGGMRMAVWRSILSAVYNRPLRPLQRLAEATACGAAMAAATAIGLCPNLADAAERFAPLGDEEVPDRAAAAVYARGFTFYQSLYPALADRFAALAALRNHSGGDPGAAGR
ncbi:MAG TPA: FGGY family carbohydrate kinase, partial [Chthonomonadaceae bacterium]|nr:FGGY family carbohydrate kinase [Chthonomonadaceae bacterium]